MADPLPTPRPFVTSLISSLQDSQVPPTQPSSTTPSSNPLRPLQGTPHRNLLTTLHVLFPSLLLPALDLLDRRLVTRATQLPPGTSAAPLPSHQSGPSERSHETSNTVYLVRSAQEPRGRVRGASRQTSGGASYGGPTLYTIRLEAWNCTCAAFAFSAFPGSAGLFSPMLEGNGTTSLLGKYSSAGSREGSTGEAKWQFGGRSFDGIDGGGVPCCKHLLACVLVDRWGEVLGEYAKERAVGKEEMAGLGAEV